jgi:DNA-binding SARP family transcriptional activator
MLRVRLVGELCVELGERKLEPIASRRARSLLAWLAYHPGLHPRSRVAAVFWPDVLDASARASLRTTLATLRRELGEAGAGQIVAERDRVGIVEGPEVWVDLWEAERMAAEGRLRDALELRDGELLTDLDDEWVLEERRVHRGRVEELLVALGDAAEEGGDADAAVGYARRRLELDPVSEEAARVLMRRLARSGERAAAVAAYDAFRVALREGLGMAPSAETRALVEELRTDAGAGGLETRALPLPGALIRAEQAPLVGRRESLAVLRAAWRRASAGAAAAVMLAGEAGSGKTRLLIELAGEAHAAGATVLAGRCPEDGGVAFAPFAEALRPYVAASHAALPEWVVAELARLLPELSAETSAPEGAAQDARHRLFEAVAAAIARAAQRTPLLLIVEDLHWADPATVQMLGHVIRTVGGAPLLVAGSLRDEGADAAPALQTLLGDLRRERRLETIELAGLSEQEAGELVAAWLGARPSPELAAALRGRTAGNPLFLEELVRHLVESYPERSSAELVAAASSEVPHGVRSVIDRRLVRLADRVRRAVEIAAVAGEEFLLADLAAACDTRDDELAGDLDAVVGTGLVDETGVPGRYRFVHALVREAVLAGLSSTRRALLHRRLAAALEELPEDRRERRLLELARHLLDAGPLVDAVTAASAALRAAEQATSSLAYEDAAALLERATATELDERDPLRVELLLRLGDALARSGDGPSAELRFVEAADRARALDDRELLARAALGAAGLTVNVGPPRAGVRALLEEALGGLDPASAMRPRLLARLAIEDYYLRPVSLRERLSAEALDAGRKLGGPALLEALGARHVALWSPAHTEERLAIADELIAAARRLGAREAELQGVNWRVADLVELGDLDAARQSIAEHERLATDLRLLGYAWYVPMWRAMLALMAGRLDEAERHSQEGERIGLAARDRNAALLIGIQRLAIRNARGKLTEADRAAIEEGARSSPAGAAWRVWAASVALDQGDIERVRGAILREVEGLASLPLDADWLYTAATLGVLVAHLRDQSAAAELYPRVLPYRDRTVTSGRATTCSGSVSLSLGLLAATLGDDRAAVAHLGDAVRHNDQLGAVPFAAAARYALAGLIGDEARAAALEAEARSAADAVARTLPSGLFSRR